MARVVGNDNIDGLLASEREEMKSKMKSRQAMFQAANDTGCLSGATSFDDLDAPEQGNCALINAAALNWAMNVAAPKVVDRYNKVGQKYVVDMAAGDKKVCVAGPCWIWASLEYQGQHKGEEEVRIVAPTFAFENRTPTPATRRPPISSMRCPAQLACTIANYCPLRA